MTGKFAHLHVHTEYSLLDGLSKIKNLLNYVKELGMDSLAITDHGVMYGAVEFYKYAKEIGIKPIIGMEGYICSGSMEDKEKGKTKNYHLILLAKNDEGYKNLMELSSIAHLKGFYYKPRFDHETLKKYSKGLICTSACLQGEIAQKITKENYEEALSAAKWYQEIFGEDFYLEIQRHHFEDYVANAINDEVRKELKDFSETEKTANEGIIKISRELGIPLVATNDAHYIKPEDAFAQDAVVCVATGKNVADTKRMRYVDSPTFYITTPKEMEELFADVPDALENTQKIADKCEVEIVLGKWNFPKFKTPDDFTPEDYLKKLAHDKLEEKFPNPTKEIKDRLEYELGVICQKGYAPYFLIVHDLVSWANDSGILTNTRGSAAGSLTSYILGITTVDPIAYNLPFERFLNPFRPSPPDIDFDVSDTRREDIIKYFSDKYGQEKVAQICTFGRMLSRAAVRDIARVLGYPYIIGDRIAKMIPPPKQGFPITITKALDEVPDLKSFYDKDPDTKKILDLAMQVEGNARHTSIHAAGIVVAPTKVTDFSPLQLEPSGEKIITQYEFHTCEEVGLIKFDILGIRNLSILGDAIVNVKNNRGEDIDIRKISLTNKKTFEMLSRGDTMGTFQLGGSGMTRYLKELKPTRVEDLMVMVALYRPGPIDNIDEYIARKNKIKETKYLHPKMKDFLDKTHGVLVYQDDLLMTAIEIAGYNWEEVDKFRKAIGKKIPEEMAKQHIKFVEGCQKISNMTKDKAEDLWNLFEPFQGYGFNKAHAASYGMVAYQTSYMKANYPVEYMTALLSAESNDIEKISAAINECRRMEIKVLPPDINESDYGFKIVANPDSLDGFAIRFGLSAIKNVGEAAIVAIIEARNKKKFSSFVDFMARADGRKVNKRVLESLIKVGALSDFGNRASLLSAIELIRQKVTKQKSLDGQEGLFATEELTESSAQAMSSLIPTLPELGEEELENLERQLLGYSLSAKPIIDLIAPIEHEATHKINEIDSEIHTGEVVKVAAVVTEVRVVVTKNTASEMAFAKVEDDTGSIELVVFPKIYKQSRDYWVEGKPLLISGKIDSREETPALLVDSVDTTESTKDKQKEVFIRIPKHASVENLQELKKLLTEHTGNSAVTLVFEEKNKRVKLGFNIDWNENLALQINDIFENQQSS